jgi:type IV pilus assembly protein PilY1
VATLRDFTYANLTLDSYNGLFDSFCTKTGASGASTPEQCPTIGGNLAAANTGSNLVSFLRGTQTLTYYRQRDHILGDVINASPLYVGKPAFKYTENGYQAWATSKAGRTAVVLAAANDGMLHAFDRGTGDELWAYIPTAVMKNMYKLADTAYGANHTYFVDGSPQVADIYVNDGSGFNWKTIVVGGLNAGGRSYYALDVTDPSAPKLLWEFTNADLGYSYGNPIITKRADGTSWVVVFTSGYNNVSPGDGNGHLFVVDANKGTLISQIKTYTSGTTPAGDTSTPSGLARINSWVDSEVVNQAKRFYGGDLLGNVWRFDVDSLVAPFGKALLMGQLTSPDGTPQPITVKPAVAEVNYNGNKYPVVYLATGRYLGTTDLSNTKTQSVTAIKDPMIDLSYGVIRSNPLFVTP